MPIVVSIALAGGTFAGLTLGLGTGKRDAAAESTSKPEEKPEASPEERPGDKPEEKPEDKPEEKPEEKVAAATPDAGAAPVPAVVKATLTFDVEPETTKISVDGVEVAGGTYELELKDGKKTVRVVAKASGHHSFDEKVDVEGDETVAIKLKKRRGGGGSSGGGTGSGTSGGSGIIDL